MEEDQEELPSDENEEANDELDRALASSLNMSKEVFAQTLDKEFKANLDREATQNFFFDKLDGEEENRTKKPRTKRGNAPEDIQDTDLEQQFM